ncbi:MAG: cell division protein FtsQ/DivIB [Flavobacteriaceae bacterium]|nr:cell division protein FtsQ/DivIB [Flavobacteriaceae bacterium]
MKRYIGYIKGLFLIVLIVFLFGFSSKRNKVKKIEDIKIMFENGDNLFITYEMVNKLLIQNYKELQSQPKENIFLNKLEKTLLSNEMIENAEVFLSIDGQLGAIITQKTPIARVNQDEQSYYIDSKGKKMPLSSNYSARVPIVEGIINGRVSNDTYTLAKMIYEDNFLKKQIVGIEQIENNEFILKTRIGDQIVELGDLTNIDLKMKKLKAFYQKTMEDKTLDKYKKINLVYNDQVVCTKI